MPRVNVTALAPALCEPLRAALPELMAIYAFGSQVSDHANDQSDLDLAVLVTGYADPLRLFSLSNALAERCGCEVDLLDFRAASTVMQSQILQANCRLWAKDWQADAYELYVLREKQHIDRWRKPLLNDILDRGTVLK